MLDPGVTFIPKALHFETDTLRTADNTPTPTGWRFTGHLVAVGELRRRTDGATEPITTELTDEESDLLVQLFASVAARVQGRG